MRSARQTGQVNWRRSPLLLGQALAFFGLLVAGAVLLAAIVGPVVLFVLGLGRFIDDLLRRGAVAGGDTPRNLLAAVIGLLGESGYEAMTMDAVAARAHASKATIYRRWPGKAELVRAAVDGHIAGRVPGL